MYHRRGHLPLGNGREARDRLTSLFQSQLMPLRVTNQDLSEGPHLHGLAFVKLVHVQRSLIVKVDGVGHTADRCGKQNYGKAGGARKWRPEKQVTRPTMSQSKSQGEAPG